MSSVMMSSGWFSFDIFSRMGMISLMVSILESAINTLALSNSVICFSCSKGSVSTSGPPSGSRVILFAKGLFSEKAVERDLWDSLIDSKTAHMMLAF